MRQGELAHRLIKRLYGLTNKKDPMKQIGKKYNRHEATLSKGRAGPGPGTFLLALTLTLEGRAILSWP